MVTSPNKRFEGAVASELALAMRSSRCSSPLKRDVKALDALRHDLK